MIRLATANLMSKINHLRLNPFRNRATLVGSLLCVALGWLATYLPQLRVLSFDIPFLLHPDVEPPNEAVIVSMNERSLKALHPEVTEHWHPGNWSRSTHTEFLHKAWLLGVKVVVFDVVFGRSEPSMDEAFAAAMNVRPHQVVLGARWSRTTEGGIILDGPELPTPVLETAAPWGMVEVLRSHDGRIRQHFANPEHPSLAMQAADIWGRAPQKPSRARWFRYYGRPGILPSIEYARFMEQADTATNLVAGKALFVGWVASPPHQDDLHPTPYTRRSPQRTSGVELHTTAFLNLIREEWLEELSWPMQLLFLVVIGTVLGGCLSQWRPTVVLIATFLLFFLVVLGGSLLPWLGNVWFPWMAIAVVQLPVAFVWSLATQKAFQFRQTSPANELTKTVSAGTITYEIPESNALNHSPSQDSTRRIPQIPDHTLLRCFGKGGYGEVWLAKDIVGNHRAVKIIYRDTFKNELPFQREFRGIQMYSPISRTHPGWVDVLHVGRNDSEGYFFYIMELGDDTTHGQDVVPNSYTPKTLSGFLKQKGRFTMEEGLELGVVLAEALEHLHGQGLIHRDIKPSNVIYVRGTPKFADIGLVTQASTSGDTSFVGTEGYLAPEGPGRPSADVFSLGKLLYEVFTGRDRRAFPEMHTALFEQFSGPEWIELQDILDKACADSPEQRYADATALKRDLLRLQEKL